MSDFSDRPLVAGSLTGLRAFSVDKLGRLTGIHHRHVFRPGENEARCAGGDVSVALFAMTRHLESLKGGQPGTPKRKPSAHQTAGDECSCGFYAYFDGGNDYAGPATVTAVVEGYGVCTVGSRGFRAEKARLVAFVRPSQHAPGGRVHRFYDRVADWSDGREGSIAIGVTFAIFAFVLSAAFAFSAMPWTLPLLLLAALLGGAAAFVWKATFHQINRMYPSVSDVSRCVIRPWEGGLAGVDWSRVLANYPDVPVYPSVEAALREHPLTVPPDDPVPTPETDPDFWTRSAR